MKSFVLCLCVAFFVILMVSGLSAIGNLHKELGGALLASALFMFIITASIDYAWPDVSVVKPARKTYTS